MYRLDLSSDYNRTISTASPATTRPAPTYEHDASHRAMWSDAGFRHAFEHAHSSWMRLPFVGDEPGAHWSEGVAAAAAAAPSTAPPANTWLPRWPLPSWLLLLRAMPKLRLGDAVFGRHTNRPCIGSVRVLPPTQLFSLALQ